MGKRGRTSTAELEIATPKALETIWMAREWVANWVLLGGKVCG